MRNRGFTAPKSQSPIGRYRAEAALNGPATDRRTSFTRRFRAVRVRHASIRPNLSRPRAAQGGDHVYQVVGAEHRHRMEYFVTGRAHLASNSAMAGEQAAWGPAPGPKDAPCRGAAHTPPGCSARCRVRRGVAEAAGRRNFSVSNAERTLSVSLNPDYALRSNGVKVGSQRERTGDGLRSRFPGDIPITFPHPRSFLAP
jgi:hypothetical protein